jgi:hypothetical protein
MAELNSLGGVTEDEIKSISKEGAGPPGDAGASPLTRFVRKVASLVAVRSEKGEQGGVSIFLKSESLVTDLGNRQYEETPLLANGNDPIVGRVWLTAAGLGTAYAIKLDWSDTGVLFQSLRSAGLGHLPAFVVDLRGAKPLARLYPEGIHIDNADAYMSIDLADDPITSDDMKTALDHFHRKSLRTPALISEGHGQRVWKKASHGIPESRPEERIHGRLMDALRARFTRHQVRAEVNTDEGRVDIVVWTKSADSAGRPSMRNDWVLELKALADRTTNGKRVAKSVSEHGVQEGLTQAMSYRDSISALRAAVCCFDMRKSDLGDALVFKSIAARAKVRKIELWRWYLFRSAGIARVATQASTSA